MLYTRATCFKHDFNSLTIYISHLLDRVSRKLQAGQKILFPEICSSFDLSIYEIKGENASSGHQRRTLVVDIDKTICGSPKGKDYSKCEPIESVCEKLREENNKGTYIILYTSRNVRTFKGNVGLINKYTNIVLAEWLKNNNIPYDEIYFNNPWGFGDLNYIDDKFLSIEEFKSD